MTAPFTASNGFVVTSDKEGFVKVRNQFGAALIGPLIGREKIVALVEYAATIGITAEGNGDD